MQTPIVVNSIVFVVFASHISKCNFWTIAALQCCSQSSFTVFRDWILEKMHQNEIYLSWHRFIAMHLSMQNRIFVQRHSLFNANSNSTSTISYASTKSTLQNNVKRYVRFIFFSCEKYMQMTSSVISLTFISRAGFISHFSLWLMVMVMVMLNGNGDGAIHLKIEFLFVTKALVVKSSIRCIQCWDYKIFCQLESFHPSTKALLRCCSLEIWKWLFCIEKNMLCVGSYAYWWKWFVSISSANNFYSPF